MNFNSFSSAPAARLVAGRVLAQLLRLQDHELVVDDDELDDQAGHDRHRDEAVEAGAETGLGTVGHFFFRFFAPTLRGYPFFREAVPCPGNMDCPEFQMAAAVEGGGEVDIISTTTLTQTYIARLRCQTFVVFTTVTAEVTSLSSE